MSTRLATLARRVTNALRYLVHGTPMPTEAPPQARVGMLDTGELIILQAELGVLILSERTTDLVRATLEDVQPPFDVERACLAGDSLRRVLRDEVDR